MFQRHIVDFYQLIATDRYEIKLEHDWRFN